MQTTWRLDVLDDSGSLEAVIEPPVGETIRVPLAGEPAEQVAEICQALGGRLAIDATRGPLALIVSDAAMLTAATVGMLAPNGWDLLTIRGNPEVVDEQGTDGHLMPAASRNGGTKSPRRQPKISYAQACRKLQKAATIHGPEHPDTKRRYDIVCRYGPQGRQGADEALQRGLRIREWFDRLYRAGYKQGENHPEVLALQKQACAEITPFWPGFATKAAERVKHGAAARARRFSAGKAGMPRLRTSAIDHRIQALRPAAAWTLLIDETGMMKAHTDQPPDERQPARFVGLLVPKHVKLPLLPPGWHAVDQTDVRQVDRVVQEVLDAPVGVIGCEVAALAKGKLDTWSQGVLEVIRWTCRLLPTDGPTSLEVLVEQQGPHLSGAVWDVAASEILRQELLGDPGRYRHLGLTVRLITKQSSPLNGYVDALAHTWGSPTPYSRQRLAQTGLLGNCLQQGDAGDLNELWESIGGGQPLDEARWRHLLQHADARTDGSLAQALIQRLQARCREDRDLWRRLLAMAEAHLGSKAVDLVALGRQVDFLAICMPEGWTMPPVLRLGWLTARLEEANHQGQVDADLVAALAAMGDRLFDEVPTLVCQADLARAVLATNRFEFAEAAAALDRWRDVPPAVPGLQHWGRIWSSFGQHAAFLGRHDEAIACFDQALEAFGRLSDPATATGERRQTAIYKATAALDARGLDPAERLLAVTSAVRLLPEEITLLAASAKAADKYRHHLLLRYLVGYGTAEQRRAYLAAREEWAVGEGHPWPLITWYRGWLLHDAGEADAAIERLTTAVAMASLPSQGPTIRFIGLALAAAARCLGMDLAMPDPGDLRQCLPAAPWALLEAAPTPGTDALALLAGLLPFNFR